MTLGRAIIKALLEAIHSEPRVVPLVVDGEFVCADLRWYDANGDDITKEIHLLEDLLECEPTPNS